MKCYKKFYYQSNMFLVITGNFDKAKVRYQHLKTSHFVLVKILKLYREKYYEEEIKPLLNGDDIIIHKIDFKSNFTMSDIRSKAANGLYKDHKQVVEDLSKVLRFIDNGSLMFIQKAKNVHTKTFAIQYVTVKDMKTSLNLIKLWRNESGKIDTAFNSFEKFVHKLSIAGIKFISDESDIFSTYQGLKYNINEEVNEELIKPFLDLINDVICVNDEVLYNYGANTLYENPAIGNTLKYIIANGIVESEPPFFHANERCGYGRRGR